MGKNSKNKKKHSYSAKEEKKAKQVLVSIGVFALILFFMIFIVFSSI